MFRELEVFYILNLMRKSINLRYTYTLLKTLIKIILY